MRSAGVYIVTLVNEAPISVNAHDPRRAESTIKVSRGHCKVGKAANLDTRQENYRKTFGAENVLFKVIALTDTPADAERAILRRLMKWRVRGANGRLNEWLFGIEPVEAEREAFEAMRQARIVFTVPLAEEHAV